MLQRTGYKDRFSEDVNDLSKRFVGMLPPTWSSVASGIPADALLAFNLNFEAEPTTSNSFLTAAG